MTLEYRRVDAVRLVRLAASHFEVAAADRQIALAVETPSALTVKFAPGAGATFMVRMPLGGPAVERHGGSSGARALERGPEPSRRGSDA